jgi:phage FluMu protein Com
MKPIHCPVCNKFLFEVDKLGIAYGVTIRCRSCKEIVRIDYVTAEFIFSNHLTQEIDKIKSRAIIKA